MLLTSEKGTRKGKAVLGAVASISPLLGFLIAFFAVLGLACIGIGIGLVSVVIGHRRIRRPTPGKLFQPYSDEKVTCLESDTLDSLKVKLFTDSLSALGLSSGLTPPPLFFVRFAEGDDPLALAYVADMAHLSFRESEFQEDVGIHTEFKIEQPALVITEQLLEADLTAQEIESIVAVLIAKVQLDPFNSLRYEAVREVGFVDQQAAQLSFNPDMLAKARSELDDELTVLMLLQDAWGARRTGQPAALKQAIQKCLGLLEGRRVKTELGDPSVFVEPVRDPDYSRHLEDWEKSYLSDPFLNDRAKMAAMRDKLISLRLESLDRIEEGVRKPGEVVTRGKPILKPNYWK